MTGFVTLVGAGIGDADLLTLKALKAMQSADIVLHDRLVSADILALIPRGVAKIFAGKSCKIHYMTQTQTNDAMVELARQGKRVVRLKGGDPFIFGRGGEEAEALAAAKIPFEVIPGITAAAACGAAAGIPLTHRDHCHSVRAITGHLNADQADAMDWAGLANDKTTLIVYMGLTNAPMITKRLIENGRAANTPVAAIMNGTLPTQRVLISDLQSIATDVKIAEFESPTLLIIGEVVQVAAKLNLCPLEIVEDSVKHHVTASSQ